jgi:hypothetical protein
LSDNAEEGKAGSCQQAAFRIRADREEGAWNSGEPMAKVKAHRVKCQFCDAASIVLVDAEICPKCCQYGYLEWEAGTTDQVFEVDEVEVEIAAEEAELLKGKE